MSNYFQDNLQKKSPEKIREVVDAEEQISLFDKILKIPGNEKCADCPTRRPTWASIDTGTMICL